MINFNNKKTKRIFSAILAGILVAAMVLSLAVQYV